MKTVRLLFSDNVVLRVFDATKDINEQLLNFENEERIGLLSDIDYHEGGHYTISNNNGVDGVEYDITFIGDNGIIEMTTKIFDVV